MLVIRGDNGSAFEEAIFVLRDESGLSEQDFLHEARKLASDYGLPSSSRSFRSILLFLIAVFVLGSAVLLLFLL